MSWDATTIANLGTAGGTLILAIATFASVRSGNRTSRFAERSLLAQLRPVLTTSRLEDVDQKVGFVDHKWLRVPGSGAVAEIDGDAIYLAMSIRNVGAGMAVLHGWALREHAYTVDLDDHYSLDKFRRLTRDIYIAPGEIGFWQGALRDPADPDYAMARRLVRDHAEFAVELLYGDHEGGQRVITRLAFIPRSDAGYMAAAGRHWNIDRADPR